MRPKPTPARDRDRREAAARFARYIRERTRDGQDLVDFMLKVVRGESVGGRPPTPQQRRDAAQGGKRWAPSPDELLAPFPWP